MTSDHGLTPESGPDGSEQDAAPTPGAADSADAADVGEAPEAAAQAEELAESDLARQLSERTLDLQRLQAEYVNYKRRVDRDRDLQRVNAQASVLSSFLPILDDLGRARDHGELEGGFKAVADLLVQATQTHGLEAFGAVGEVFDPNLHEALMHRMDAEAPEGEPTIEAVMQVGYRLSDKILRPARVAVVEHDPSVAESEGGAGDEPSAE